MTVEPGFGGQKFMKDVARDKLLAARDLLRHKAFGGEVHVDGGINRETAEFVGGLGVDVLVVGSALWVKGHDMGREIRLIRALADEGYQYTPERRRRADPARQDGDLHARSRSTSPSASWTRSRPAAIPVVMLRGDGQINPDGIRDYDLLVPASVEALVIERHADARTRYLRDADGWRERFIAEHGRHPAAQPPVRAVLQRTTGARVTVDGEVVGEIGAGLVILLGVGPDDGEATADELARKAAELRIFRDDDGPDEPVAARHRRGGAGRLAVHALSPTRAAAAGPGSPAPPRRSSPSASTCASPTRSGVWA